MKNCSKMTNFMQTLNSDLAAMTDISFAKFNIVSLSVQLRFSNMYPISPKHCSLCAGAPPTPYLPSHPPNQISLWRLTINEWKPLGGCNKS